MEKSEVIARKKARRIALQALYQWMIAGNDLADIQAQAQVNNNMSKVDEPYFIDLLHGIPKQVATLDEILSPHLDRPIEQLNPIEFTILRMGTYELSQHIDIPYKVVIDEAVKLAREFGAVDGHKYVNGVLDKVAKQLRPHE